MTLETKIPASQILVACNDSSVCDAIRGQFENDGYAIHQCCSLSNFSEADLNNYSALLMELPENNNSECLQTIATIKQGESTYDMPLLVFTTSRKTDLLVNVLNAGADDFLVKPFSVRELSARLHAILRSCRRG